MREPKVQIAFGMKGVGKTYATKLLIKQYIAGTKTFKGRPVLILDTQGEYTEAKAIYYDPDVEDQFTRAKSIRAIAKPYLYRLISKKPNGQIMTDEEIIRAVLDVCLYFKNGLFVMEDINTYITSSLPRGFFGLLVSVRHRGIDLIIHYQGIGDPPPKIWRNANIIRLHKTIDTVLQPSTFKKVPNPELIRLGEIVIEKRIESIYDSAKSEKIKRGAKHTYLYIDVENNKFKGIKPEEITQEVITQYFLENKKRENQIRISLISQGIKKEKIKQEIDNKFRKVYL